MSNDVLITLINLLSDEQWELYIKLTDNFDNGVPMDMVSYERGYQNALYDVIAMLKH